VHHISSRQKKISEVKRYNKAFEETLITSPFTLKTVENPKKERI